MHFFIDGYNLLFFHLTPDENLKKTREELIQLLDKKLKALNIKATLIFDGFNQIESAGERQYFDALTVVFSPRSETADEYILEHVSSAKKPNEITVITGDKKLAQAIRNLGAHCKTPKVFLKEIAKKQLQKENSETKSQTELEETRENIERLLNLFEKRLQESEFEL
jgi:predicted RNA-binding protein with PIN domain